MAECEAKAARSHPHRRMSHSAMINTKYKAAHVGPTFLLLLLLIACHIHESHQQSSISLNNAQWFVSNANGSLVVPAQVPGGIYSDLRRANVLKQEILMGKNDLAYRWVGQENWTYTTSFAIDQQIAMSQSVKLLLHGVDTVATVYLNGEEIGSTDNMFVRYKFDVKPYLKLAGLKNILVVKFESPIKYAHKRFQQSLRHNRGKIIPPFCAAPAQRGECHANFIRKMQASFSWDWGPAFPSSGIYKNIELEYGSFGVIRDILVETRRLTPPVPPRGPMPPAQVVISSSIKNTIRTPGFNRTGPFLRAPPFYHAPSDLSESGDFDRPPERLQILASGPGEELTREEWLLKIHLVAEMVQPSFGYNIRVEFNLEDALHYESQHINVVANSEGVIRLGFNLRVDQNRLPVRPWWPNNAGAQRLYRFTARILPIPNAPELLHQHAASPASSLDALANQNQMAHLQARAKPLQTPAVPPMIFLATPTDLSSHLIQQVSEKEIKFGFRTVELIQEPITRGNVEDGLSFNFRINGVDLFAMGSNWVPASVLPENHLDLEHVRYLLQSAKDAHMNMLRVWGGGIYESDEFYQMADEMGIMIWHDFMFACALYPTDDDYIASVRTEIEQQVQRLQYHPSIVLWAGNNENEMAIAGPWWPEVMLWPKKLRESYHKLYVENMRPIVQVLDPMRPFVISSPSNGLISESQPNAISRQPNEPKYGDVHHYDYLTDSFDWSVYPSTRFASEYGFQSYPSFNALTSFTTPNDWKYPLTGNILHRQHRLTGETEIKLQIKLHFNELKQGGPDKLKSFIYVSQLSQAIAIKTETEFYRRNRFVDPETKLGHTMGALYWQLNDVWQAPTWSSIEYGGKWKMLHYFARRFFFPVQVMPYIVQPTTLAGALSNAVQQSFPTVSSVLSSLSAPFQDNSLPPPPPQQQQQQQTSSSPLFAVDLVRDDSFHYIDAFNVTIRFYRWTSFVPVWQDAVYVRNTRPQNVTRIYEQEVARIVRQPGVISLSSGVFQVLIEEQRRLGLSQIENYLMPVNPNKVTAMRVAKINVELIQGPFELGPEAAHWACAYRLTLVSDSIAMFVWLDLNFLNSGQENLGEATQPQGAGRQQPPSAERRSPPATNIHLDALPAHVNVKVEPDFPEGGPLLAPEHIRLHVNNHQSNREPRPPQAAEFYEAAASERIDQSAAKIDSVPAAAGQDAPAADVAQQAATVAGATSDKHQMDGQTNGAADQTQPPPAARRKRQAAGALANQAAQRLVLNINQANNRAPPPASVEHHGAASAAASNRQAAPLLPPARLKPSGGPQTRFKPVDASGGQLLRYQFSDNAFNMFEPSKVIDLYLSRCLSKAQIEVALEIQSLADCL